MSNAELVDVLTLVSTERERERERQTDGQRQTGRQGETERETEQTLPCHHPSDDFIKMGSGV